MTRARRVDPAQHPPINFEPMPQDGQNYLRQSPHLSPGCRIECGFGRPGSHVEGMNPATSAGVKLRRFDGQEVLTVSYHGFLISQEVYHPFADEDKIGDIIGARPELDIALVELTPTASEKFTNTCYFQAETPRVLLEGSEIKQGSWSEVDGMSSGRQAASRPWCTGCDYPGHAAVGLDARDGLFGHPGRAWSRLTRWARS